MSIQVFILLFSFVFMGCVSGKICSDNDRGCSTQALILSAFSSPPGIYMYSSPNSFQGNLAASGFDIDSGLQNICLGSKLLAQTINLGCTTIHPFVSTPAFGLTSFAGLYGVPTTIPVRGAKGDIIASDWNSLLVSIADISLVDAGVTTDTFWTFTTGGGAYDSANNCSGGTDATSGFTGSTGDPTNTAVTWFGFGASSCDQFNKVLCICY